MDYISHVVSKLWDTIAPIINLMSRKMKQFLGVYGVDESMISPFCKDFESISELRDELLLQSPQILQQQKKEQGTDT